MKIVPKRLVKIRLRIASEPRGLAWLAVLFASALTIAGRREAGISQDYLSTSTVAPAAVAGTPGDLLADMIVGKPDLSQAGLATMKP